MKRSILWALAALGCQATPAADVGEQKTALSTSDPWCTLDPQERRLRCVRDTGIPAPGMGGAHGGPVGICALASVTGGGFRSGRDYVGVTIIDGTWQEVIDTYFDHAGQDPIEMESTCVLETKFNGLSDGFVSTTLRSLAGIPPDHQEMVLPDSSANAICPLTAVSGLFGYYAVHPYVEARARVDDPSRGRTTLELSAPLSGWPALVGTETWCTDTGSHTVAYNSVTGLPAGSALAADSFANQSENWCFLSGVGGLDSSKDFARLDRPGSGDGMYSLHKGTTDGSAYATCVPYAQK